MTEKLIIRPSSLSTWMNCPWKWYKHHIEGVPSIPNVKMIAGTATHKGAEVGYTEKIESGKLPPKSVMTDAAVEEFHRKLKEDVDVQEDENPDDYEKIVVENISLYEPLMERTEPNQVEAHFRLPITSDYVEALEGTADIVEKASIVDIKTTLRKATPRNYVLQLSAYALLAENEFGKKFDTAGIHNIVNGKAVYDLPLELAKERTHYLLETLVKSVDTVLSGKAAPEVVFTGNPTGFLCDSKYCKLYHDCPFVKGEVK